MSDFSQIYKPIYRHFDFAFINEKMREETFHYISLTFIFCVSFGLMLFNYDGFIDNEWQFYLMPSEIQTKFWLDRRVPLVGYIYNALFVISKGGYPNGFIPFKIFGFLSHLFVGLIFYTLLKRLDFIKKMDAFFLTALAITLPIQESKLLSSFLWYSIHLLIFMLAFLNLAYSKTIFGRFITLSLFFLSFFLESLLIFYAVPMMYYAYIEKEKWLKINIKNSLIAISKWTLVKFDYFILPLIFLFMNHFWKITLWPGKNEIFFKNLIIGIPKTIFISFIGFIEILNNAFTNFSAEVLVVAIFMIKFFPYKYIQFKSKKQTIILFFLGCLFFYLAVYPYIVVNMLLTSEYGDSRTQLLTLFGISFILYYGLQYLFGETYRNFFPIICSIIIALFISQDVNRIMSYQIHCTKTNRIIEKLKSLTPVKEGYNKRFIMIDNATAFNLKGIKPTAWDVMHWLKMARDNTKYNDYDCFGFFDYENNNKINKDGKYDDMEIIGKIIINTKVQELSTLDKLRIVFYNVLDKKNYNNFLENIGFIELQYEPL